MSPIMSGIVASVKKIIGTIYNFTVPSKSVYDGGGNYINNYRISTPSFDSYGGMYQLIYSVVSPGSTNIFVLTKRDAITKNLIWVKTLESQNMLINQGGFHSLVVKNSIIYIFLYQNIYCPTFDLDGNYIKTIKTIGTQLHFIVNNYFVSFQQLVCGSDYYGDYYDYSLQAVDLSTGSSIAVGGPIISGDNKSVQFVASDSLNKVYSGRQAYISNSFTEVQEVTIGDSSPVYAYRTYSNAGSGNDYIYNSRIVDLIVRQSNKTYALQQYYSNNNKQLRILVSNTASNIASMYPITTITVAQTLPISYLHFDVDFEEKYAYVLIFSNGTSQRTLGLLKIDLSSGDVVWKNSIVIKKTGATSNLAIYPTESFAIRVSKYTNELSISLNATGNTNNPFAYTYLFLNLPTDGSLTGLKNYSNTGVEFTYTTDSNSYTYTTSTYSTGNLALTLNSTTARVNRGTPVQSFSSNPPNLVLGSISTSSYDLESSVAIA